MAVHVGAGSLQSVPRFDRACPVSARARLHSAGAEHVRHVLLRQGLHPAVLVPADVLSRRPARRLPLLPLCANAAEGEDCRCQPDAGSWTCGGRGSPAARHRKRRGQEDLAGRRTFTLGGRPRAVDPRRACAW